MPIIRSRTGEPLELSTLPIHCPNCSQPLPQLDGTPQSNQSLHLEIVFECVHCDRFFIAYYQGTPAGYTNFVYFFGGTLPMSIGALPFTDSQISISEGFAKIYEQATKAEAMQLDQIAGVGYRKALEFLIKDYCIAQFPDKADLIKKYPLGKVISDFVNNDDIKDMASRAVWLGNDETHYVRLFEQHDIESLKELIAITAAWIDLFVKTAKYRSEMQSRK